MTLLRFNLRSLLFLIAFIAITLAWVAWQRTISAKQEAAIDWLNRNSSNGLVDGSTQKLYLDEYPYCANGGGTRYPFLRDDIDGYMRPVFGRRYLGADRLRLSCDESFAFNRVQIERLHDLVDLKTISLFAYTLTDDQLLRFTGLPKIENLLLSGAFLVTDESAVHIAHMPELYELELSGSQITDKTLKALCNCRQLSEIALDGNDGITYEGAQLLRDSLKPARFDVSRCGRISIEQQQELSCHGPSRY